MLDRTAVYNLKAVLKETGMNAEALRAWERRYGLPRPERTPGGHRLYSAHDIATLKWLLARQDEGLSISRAIDLWRELETSGRDPLADTAPATPPPPPVVADAGLETLRNAWLAACLTFQETAAEQTLNQAFAMHDAETVCVEVLQRGLNQVGELWYTGQASVQQEHFASALAIRRLDTLLASTPPPTRPQTVLIACPPGEWHTFTPLLLSLMLRRRGWNVVYLGASVPVERMEEAVAMVRPALVVLAAQQLVSAAGLVRTAQALRERGIPTAYGGRVFNRIPDLRGRVPAPFLGESLQAAVANIADLALTPAGAPSAQKVSEGHLAALEAFRLRRAFIETELAARLGAGGLPAAHIAAANTFFGDSIAAALELGDLAYLEPDMDWLRNLLGPHGSDQGRLAPFLRDFIDICQDQIGPACAPLRDWLGSFITTLERD